MALSLIDQSADSSLLGQSKLVMDTNNSILDTEIGFYFTLAESKTTSAGVYDSGGTKIRDLWGGVRLPAGTHYRVWDGKDDDGVQQSPGTYTVKVLHHNLGFTLTNLFNTSKNRTGKGLYYQFGTLQTISFAGSDLWFNRGYTEGAANFVRSTLSVPNDFAQSQAFEHMRSFLIAGDATGIWAAVGYPQGSNPHRYGIMRLLNSTNDFTTFSGLTSDGLNYNSDFPTAPSDANFSAKFIAMGIGANRDDHTYDITGIAVQQTGNYLAVAQKESDKITIFHKTSGATVVTLNGTVTDPIHLCWSPDEADLWVATGSTVKVLTPSGGDWTSSISTTDVSPGGVVCGLAATTSGTNRVAVAVGGTVQQVLGYNATTKVVAWTIGASGGYGSTTTVADNRFHFVNYVQGWDGTLVRSQVEFDENDDLWTLEQSMIRLQRFASPAGAPSSSAAKYMMVAPYNFTGEITDGTKFIVNGYCLMTRDWSKTNNPGVFGGGSNAWVFSNFYGYNDYETLGYGQRTPLQRMINISGRTYAIFTGADEDARIVELTSTGIRDCGVSLGNKEWRQGIRSNFDRYYYASGKIKKATFQSFDGSNNPSWTISDWCTPATGSNDPGIGAQDGNKLPAFSDGTIFLYQGDLTNNTTKYHCGALRSDGTWKWRQARRQVDVQFPYPTDGRISGNVVSQFDTAAANNDFAVLSANGEGYSGGQSGQHIIYDINGLYVGQLGWESPAGGNGGVRWPALGENGNASNTELIFDGTTYRYLHATEWSLSGIAEWTFNNLASYGVISDDVALGAVATIGSPSADGGTPSVIGSVGFSDNFGRADGDTIGNGWTKALGSNSMELLGGMLKGKSNVYNEQYSNIIYRDPYTGSTALNTCTRLTIPAGSLGSPLNYHRIVGSEHRHGMGLWSRFNSSTGAGIGVQAWWIRYEAQSGQQANGYWNFYFFATDGTIRHNIGSIFATNLPALPGNSYSLTLAVTGTQPTRLYAELYDEDQLVKVLGGEIELWDTQWESAGKVALNITYENVRINGFEERALTWSSVQPPIR